MSIRIHATYRDGALYLEQPLDLPEDTRVIVTVTPSKLPDSASDSTAVPIVRPSAPQITAEEIRDRIARYGVRVGTLPADFSRADIY